MVGIVSEESFEAFHCCLVRVKDLLKSMPSHLSRVEISNARMQSLLKKEIMEGTIKLDLRQLGKRLFLKPTRGKQNQIPLRHLRSLC